MSQLRRPDTAYATSETLGNPFVGDSVYVVNGAACDAANRAGCGQTLAAITLKLLPSNPVGITGQRQPFQNRGRSGRRHDLHRQHRQGRGPGTVSVINGAICNAHDITGCDQTPRHGTGRLRHERDRSRPVNNQIYATNIEDTSITTINGNVCNPNYAGDCDHTRTRPIDGDYPNEITVEPESPPRTSPTARAPPSTP